MKITSLKRKNIRAAFSLFAIFVAFAFVLSIFSGSSQAFTKHEGLYDDPASVLKKDASFALPFKSPSKVPPSPIADVCLPLLKTTSHTPSASVMDRNRRSAGKAAALSLVLGVRFALSPSDNAALNVSQKASLDVLARHNATIKKPDSRSALSVSAYRQCQKQQALKAMSASR